MPELPEVEFARQQWLRWTKRRRVIRTESDKTRVFRGAKRQAFADLRGRVLDVTRRGKYLLLRFEADRGLLSHLGMTGKFVRSRETKLPYSRARWFLNDGNVIHYVDPRLFGRLEPAPAESLLHLPVIAALGADPWTDTWNTQVLKDAVGKTRQPLKVALMDQRLIAGLGNIHAAEALYRAKIHPSRKVSSLTPKEWAKLARAIRASLAFALQAEQGEQIEYVEEGGDNPFLVYGRAKERCKRCGGTLQSMVQAGRTTHFCPSCQT